MKTSRVKIQISSLRDFLSNPWFKQQVSGMDVFWNQICSSMDTIEDTEDAIEAYQASDLEASEGMRYLRLYGILQALYVQQDAVVGLGKCFGCKVDLSGIIEVRNLRNCTVGHPTKTFDKSSHFVSRPTITNNGFQLLSFCSAKGLIVKEVCVLDHIVCQEKWATNTLGEIIAMQKNKYSEHKKKFKGEKIVSVFPKTMDWHLAKIYEGITGDVRMGELHLKLISKTIEDFKLALIKRGLKLDSDVYEDVEYPLRQLALFFKAKIGGECPSLDIKAAEIFGFYLRARMIDLRDTHAREIDEEFLHKK